MAKKNIYIHDSIYEKMLVEAEKRGISFSHACSLAFSCWLDSVKAVGASLSRRSKMQEKDPSEMR